MNSKAPVKHVGFTLSLIAAASLAGCGGGGGGNAPAAAQAAAQPNAPQAPTRPMSSLAPAPRPTMTLGFAARNAGAGPVPPADLGAAPANPANNPRFVADGGAPLSAVAGRQAPSTMADFGEMRNRGSAAARAYALKHAAQWEGVRMPAGEPPSPSAFDAWFARSADTAHPELGTDLQRQIITGVHPLPIPPARTDATMQNFVALSNALLQIALHDPEYAARLAFPGNLMGNSATLAGRISYKAFRLLYREYDIPDPRYRDARQQDYLEILGNRPGFAENQQPLDDAARCVANAMGLQGLGLPYEEVFFESTTTADQVADALADHYERMLVRLIERGDDFAHDLKQYRGEKVVPRAFVLGHPIGIEQVPGLNRLESFVVSNGRGNYAAFVNMPDTDGTDNWFIAADGKVRNIPRNNLGEFFELNQAIVSFFGPSGSGARQDVPGIVMVVYRAD